MSKFISLVINSILIIISLFFVSCSNDNTVNTNPNPIDTSGKFINLSNKIIEAGGFSEQLRDIEVVGANFWIATVSGNIYVSRDSANSFTKVILPMRYSSSIFMFNDGLNGWCVNDTLVLKTTNGGFNWTSINFPNGPFMFEAISFFQQEPYYASVGYIVGQK